MELLLMCQNVTENELEHRQFHLSLLFRLSSQPIPIYQPIGEVSGCVRLSHRAILHIRIEIESLRIGQSRKRDWRRGIAPVGTHPPPHRRRIVACREVIIAGLGIAFFAGEVGWVKMFAGCTCGGESPTHRRLRRTDVLGVMNGEVGFGGGHGFSGFHSVYGCLSVMRGRSSACNCLETCSTSRKTRRRLPPRILRQSSAE